MKALEFIDLPLEGLKYVRGKRFLDERGLFWESYREPLYRELGIDVRFVQDNYSVSKRGTIRGMHFQRRPGQAKLISVLEGEIFDVVVDIRKESKTFGAWHGTTLEPGHQLFVPVGFAHGFCSLSERAHVLYKVSSVYDPMEECGFSPHDTRVGIKWPEMEAFFLSGRDQEAPSFEEVVV